MAAMCRFLTLLPRKRYPHPSQAGEVEYALFEHTTHAVQKRLEVEGCPGLGFKVQDVFIPLYLH